MSEGADVGVVVATHNRRASVLATLEQLEALPERPPIVVVDNGSADGTAAAVRSSHPGVTLLALDRNRGAFARNIGADRVQMPLIAFCDDDSWWLPGALSVAAEVFRRHPRLGLIAARVMVGSERRLDPLSAVMRGPAPDGLPGPRVTGFLACGTVMRREPFLAVGGFCERFMIGAEEELLAIDMRAAGWDLCYADEVVAIHDPHLEDRGPRGSLSRRNALWTSWLRKPAGRALRDTAALGWQARSDPVARLAVGSALRGIPWALVRRRPAPAWLLREWDEPAGRGSARIAATDRTFAP